LKIHENVPDDLPEDERMQMLIEEICETECRVERERLVKDFGDRDGAAAARALEAAVSEFQLKVEELVVRRGRFLFGHGAELSRRTRRASLGRPDLQLWPGRAPFSMRVGRFACVFRVARRRKTAEST
jgi:hypothetical protein